MKCQKCNKNEANTHYTQVINGKKTEWFMCSECAAQNEELNNFQFGFDNDFDSFDSFFSGFLSNPYQSIGMPSSKTDSCDMCHMTFNEFLKGGRLGCSACYDKFSNRLKSYLKQIHGSAKHTGKVPERAGEKLKNTRKLEKLEFELQSAVNTQNFERAAEIRDMIRDIKGEV